MKIHEYQAKEILDKGGVAVPEGGVATTSGEARAVATRLGRKVVVKAQVHAGGRGKAGGIKVVSTPQEAEEAAKALLGTTLVTFQTGPEGAPVNSVLVEEAIEVKRELYLGLVIDGAAQGVVVMASAAGGMEIEEVAENMPELLLREKVDPVLGLLPFQGRKIAFGLDIGPKLVRPLSTMIANLYQVFLDNDCSLVEINPLVLTEDGRILAADAKMDFEDDAFFRHKDLEDLRDTSQEDPLELRAREADVSYVKLDGTVGCLVNGAGLAMATLDVIGESGASPANFLDVGGGANEEKVAEALRIILSDPNVDTVLINIFGGILRGDMIAGGILAAIEGTEHQDRRIVVRMLGTNADQGRQMLQASSLNLSLVENLGDVADAIRASK
ncbi:MAG: ADP-forming succinate--CoA ligase subunit beta [SAR202 cluster bacterium]|nr:ADP-forming succinate--CoA ligase subunit beta [SAR202 cluster bacterium]